ncbi:MAG: hypothetical protein ABII88_01045 [Candidatus Omnitrophota bacterium]
MKGKLLNKLFIMMVSILILPVAARAELVLVADIGIEAFGPEVKISVTSNLPLQIETFKSEEGSSNYIVVDFLGAVYSDLPPVVDISSGAVEKVSLVRGEEQPVSVDGKEYYTLDFLAINLNADADYKVDQDMNVIDLKITAVAKSDKLSKESEAVVLEPPVVVTPRKVEVPKIEKKEDVEKAEKENKKEEARLAKEAKKAERAKKKEEVRLAKEAKKAERAKKKEEAGLAKEKLEKKIESKNPEKKKNVLIVKAEPEQNPEVKKTVSRAVDPANKYIIDKVVQDTMREKEQVNSRIEELTAQLQRMQKDLDSTKGEKSKIESKISEILSRLDDVNDALGLEIKRRRELGEQVEDLVEKRKAYTQAKRTFETVAAQLADTNDKVDTLTAEAAAVKGNISELEKEKSQLESKFGALSTESGRFEADYEEALDLSNRSSAKVDELRRKLEQMEMTLAKTLKDEEALKAKVKDLESKRKFSSIEASNFKQKLMDKEILLDNLSRKYEQLNNELELSLMQKDKLDEEYKDAKNKYEQIKREVKESIKN